LSFNGGKDCTVLFHLLRAALAHKRIPLSALDIVYFAQKNEFAEVTDFLRVINETYDLSYRVSEEGFKQGLQDSIDNHGTVYAYTYICMNMCHSRACRYFISMLTHTHTHTHIGTKAIFMGQRKIDPHSGNLALATPTDASWPQVRTHTHTHIYTYIYIYTYKAS
jgi:FAD synthetase